MHTGHTLVFGGAPKPVGQPQKILVRVASCTCTSRPMTGSYFANTSGATIVIAVEDIDSFYRDRPVGGTVRLQSRAREQAVPASQKRAREQAVPGQPFFIVPSGSPTAAADVGRRDRGKAALVLAN